MLRDLVARHVDARVRSRGQAYHASGAVTVLNGSSTQVQALVKGSDVYLVLLRRRGNRLRAWCICPYCDENLEVCKHIWATLLAAEKHRHLNAGSTKRLTIDADDSLAAELEGDGGDAVDDEGDDVSWEEDDLVDGEEEPRWRPPVRRSPKKAAKPRRASWQQKLVELRHGFEERTNQPADGRPGGKSSTSST